MVVLLKENLLFGAVASFWNVPVDVFVDHLDGAGLAVDAVLGVDLELGFSFFIFHELVDFRWTEAFFHAREFVVALQGHICFAWPSMTAAYLIRRWLG